MFNVDMVNHKASNGNTSPGSRSVTGVYGEGEHFNRILLARGSTPLRASYHGKTSKEDEESSNTLHVRGGRQPEVVSSAESLVGRALVEEGLGKYLDSALIQTTKKEMAEAYDMTLEEIDRAAEMLLLRGNPATLSPPSSGNDPTGNYSPTNHMYSAPNQSQGPLQQLNYSSPPYFTSPSPPSSPHMTVPSPFVSQQQSQGDSQPVPRAPQRTRRSQSGGKSKTADRFRDTKL